MKPGLLRTAIVTALAQRDLWEGVDLFRFPAADLAEWPSGLELGPVAPVDSEDITLAADLHQVEYTMAGMLWVAGSGSADDDFDTVEAKSMELITDLRDWIVETNHRPSVDGYQFGYVELDGWEQTFTAEPGSVIDFTLAVTEYI